MKNKLRVTNELGEETFNFDRVISNEEKESILRTKIQGHFALISCVNLNNNISFDFVNEDYYLLKDILDYLRNMQTAVKPLDISISFFPTLKDALDVQLLMHNQF